MLQQRLFDIELNLLADCYGVGDHDYFPFLRSFNSIRKFFPPPSPIMSAFFSAQYLLPVNYLLNSSSSKTDLELRPVSLDDGASLAVSFKETTNPVAILRREY